MSKPSTSRKKADDDGSKKKKQKKKKDPNAPKRAISAFMYFSQSEREVGALLHDFLLRKPMTSPAFCGLYARFFVLRIIETYNVHFEGNKSSFPIR